MHQDVEEAVGLIQSKRPDTAERVLELLQKTVFSFSMKVCGHREDAEDTSQEVLLKAIPHLPRFDSPQALAVWLYKVAKNRCLMSRRRSKFAPERELSLEELMPGRGDLQRLLHPDSSSPEASAVRAEDAHRLRAALHRLPPPYRLVLVLHDMEELSTGEVAQITGLKEGTVRVRLHRARLFLRKHFNKQAARPRLNGTAPQAQRSVAARSPRCKRLFARLSDYLDDELEASLCKELESHLSGCIPCAAFLDSLKNTVQECLEYQVPSQPGESIGDGVVKLR